MPNLRQRCSLAAAGLLLLACANVANLVSFVESVMTDRVRRAELQRDLVDTAAKLGKGGAAGVAGDAILDLLESHAD